MELLTRLRQEVYATFADEGRAPSAAELARLTATSVDATLTGLRALHDAHALVLTPDGDAIRMAHPFSAAPMGFVVTPLDGHDDRRWWGGCAWDSFGIGAALSLDVRVDTNCPWCGDALRYQAGPTIAPPAPLVVRFPRPAAQWWDDVVDTCTSIRTFCSLDHAEQWERARGTARGESYLAEAATVWRLAQPWYGDRLDLNFHAHSRDHNQALLTTVGLTGAFWRLP